MFSFLNRIGAWLDTLAAANPQWTPWLPVVAFAALFAALSAVGRIALRGKRRAVDGAAADRRKPLLFGPATRWLSRLIPAIGETAVQLRAELRQAGRYGRSADIEFLALRNTLVLGILGVTWAAASAASIHAVRDPRLVVWCVGGMLAMVAFSLPRLMLQGAAKARLARIQTGLPDALDMVTMCMTGGLSLQKALSRVADELSLSHPDVATELRIIRRHADAYSLEHAMEQFAERIDVPEVRSLSALVAQTERLGANVGAALREFADGVRRAFRQRAEERGNRTSVKMLLPVSLCLAPPVYILLLAPALLELRDFVTRENRPGGVLAPAQNGLETVFDEAASGRP